MSSCAKNGKGGNGGYILEHGFYADGVLTSGAFNQRLGKVATLIAQEYTAIMDDLGVEEGTLAHRKKVLGGILKDFSDDLQDEFDGDEAAITAHAETLSLEDYYAALKSYLLQEELVSAPTLEC
ncbi:MAG: hypothetical protein COB14_09820 [Alphaproteobacteria bacterium]|nr:MAG: hypothetical protein COB14_09820 [Alphaproteobacteria bacterium]